MRFVRRLVKAIGDDEVFVGAAALGFYLTLAIFPAMIFLIAMIPFLPIAAVDQAIMDFLRQILPGESADMFTGVVTAVAQKQHGGLLAAGFIGALWSASSGTRALMQQLNEAYDVEESRSFLAVRGMAVVLTILGAVLVLCAFSLVVLGGMIESWLGDRFGFKPELLVFFVGFRWIVIVAALLCALGLVYRWGPDRRRRLRLFTVGNVVGTAMLLLASVLFSFYVTHFTHYDATYGSVGAMIALMLWLYVIGLVVLVGAEIDRLLGARS